jgi:hypothetical protein
MSKPRPSRTKKDLISRYMAEIGAKGGATKGKSKARPSEMMSEIAKQTWAKKKAKACEAKPTDPSPES